MADADLAVEELCLSFGGLQVLDGVSLHAAAGRTLALIGPNGAGKTSLFNCLSRLYTPSSGSIRFQGQDVLAHPSYEVASLGIGRTFQNNALFGTMTVAENLMVGAHHWSVDGLVAAVVRTRALRRQERRVRERLAEVAAVIALGDVLDRPAGELPFPTQKRIELGRALMAEPRLLLLDEPAGGLTTAEVGELSDLLARVREELSLSYVLVEHRMSMIMALADDAVVLDSGRVIYDGPPDGISSDPGVVRAYLGGGAARPVDRERA